MTVPPFSIGADIWPGLSKLTEECSELLQAVGKLQAFPDGNHPDGVDWRRRLEEEIADVRAATTYVVNKNGLSQQRIGPRMAKKLMLFTRWHKESQE